MTTVSSAQAWWTADQAAQPGDIILVASGTYDLSGTYFTAKHAAPGVTFQPAPGAEVIVSNFNISGQGYTVSGGFDVQMTPDIQYGTYIGGTDVTFQGNKIHQSDNKTLSGVGVFVRYATNVKVLDNEIAWVGSGIANSDNTNIDIMGNLIHDVQTDFIINAGSANSVVKGNTLTRCHNAEGGHPDAIQWWSSTSTSPATPCTSLEIAENRIEFDGIGDQFQGPFGEGGTDVSVHDNIVIGTMYNGITLSGTDRFSFKGNFLQASALPGVSEDGLAIVGTAMGCRNLCQDGVIDGNAVPGGHPWVGYTGDGNVTDPYQTITDPATGQQVPNPTYNQSVPSMPRNVSVTNNTSTDPAMPGDYTQANDFLTGLGKPVISAIKFGIPSGYSPYPITVTPVTPPAGTSPVGSTLSAPFAHSLVTAEGTWTFATTQGDGGYDLIINGKDDGQAIFAGVGSDGNLYAYTLANNWYVRLSGAWKLYYPTAVVSPPGLAAPGTAPSPPVSPPPPPPTPDPLQGQVDQLTAEVADLQTKLAATLAADTADQATITDLQTKLAAATASTSAALKAQVASLQAQLSNLQLSYQSSQSLMNMYKSQFNAALARISKAKADLS